MKKLMVIVYLLLGGLSLMAQKAPDFTLVNAIDNAEVSLSEFQSSKGVVLIFTSNNCAYSVSYENRLIELAKTFQDQGVAFLFINPNNPDRDPEEAPEKMIAKFEEMGLRGSYYLVDPGHTVADSYRIRKLPQAVLIQPNAGVFDIKYQGAIDDNPQVANDVSERYLYEVIQALLTGQVISNNKVRAVGCSIEY